ncbi:MAG: hypothetical protein KDC87_00560 [Planctomycetes bacterium]|nr:hypothetical protein [Planctomycetota bacterium]MCB9869229.1 hypothetical protein [Planctomycetota bacterium]MCB9889372.1 hypothetical protein [Planctomycetota bacterium]
MKDRIPRALFLLACLFLAFLYGFAASQFQWFPHGFLAKALFDLRTAATGPAAAQSLHHKYPARHDLAGVRSNRGVTPDARPGITLLTSYWPEDGWKPGVRLIDDRGTTLHHWTIDIPKIWPTSPHRDPMAGTMNQAFNYVHGSYLFPNGDLLVNIEYLGLARLNVRGEVLWRLDRRTHHSVHRAEDGNFWVCSCRWIERPEANQRFPGLRGEFWDDIALLVSPDGQVLKELSMLEVLFRSRHRALLWYSSDQQPDRTHMNDIEPLPSAMAADYPLFKAGDLLISMRNVSLVMVVDPAGQTMRWAAPAIFSEQHDPDFIGDGWISVFDNRGDGSLEAKSRGGSGLLAMQPHTGALKMIYPRPGNDTGERWFHSIQGGKAQMLPSGGWLITESTAGRVFEVDQAGHTVWEWGQQRHDDNMVSEVLEGTRYPFAPETVKGWTR